jgi:ssDNA-binding Zn-finger/Zn-ribbon topoisomerase 1
MTSKDQSGAQAAGEWLRERGLATYNPRTTRKTLEQRVTEPVTFDHWQTVVDMGRCLACSSTIHHKRNTKTGGDFHICSQADCGWYIGYTVSKATGYQVKL